MTAAVFVLSKFTDYVNKANYDLIIHDLTNLKFYLPHEKCAVLISVTFSVTLNQETGVLNVFSCQLTTNNSTKFSFI